jgi:hypothetical protein
MSGLPEQIRYPVAWLLDDAHQFIMKQTWKQRVLGYWSGIVEGGLVGVFLYKINPAKPDVPPYHWVVVGPDIPHAYITTDDAPNPACALESYFGVMLDWIDAVTAGKDTSNVYPVQIPDGTDALSYARRVEIVLKRIDAEVLSKYQEDLKA